jgi:uncharacterized protein YlxP (DUF503 family)
MSWPESQMRATGESATGIIGATRKTGLGKKMIIGTCQVELLIPNNHSLKGKRKVIKSIKDRVRARFNVSIAEIDRLEEWQRATLGIACISNEVGLVDRILSKVVSLIETSPDAALIDYQTEILR